MGQQLLRSSWVVCWLETGPSFRRRRGVEHRPITAIRPGPHPDSRWSAIRGRRQLGGHAAGDHWPAPFSHMLRRASFATEACLQPPRLAAWGIVRGLPEYSRPHREQHQLIGAVAHGFTIAESGVVCPPKRNSSVARVSLGGALTDWLNHPPISAACPGCGMRS